jgi:hypothetical protein
MTVTQPLCSSPYAWPESASRVTLKTSIAARPGSMSASPSDFAPTGR